GYVQRLALAQAALGGRRILLLDETLAGLDPLVRRRQCDRLMALAGTGVAVLLSSHDLAAVERLASRVLILARGRVVREGSMPGLLRERVLEVVLDTPPRAPRAPPRVTMYTCGPTVWNFAHIGNFRTFLFEDLLRRHLEWSGYDVFHIMNLTDVDDRVIKAAAAAGKRLAELTEPFVRAF